MRGTVYFATNRVVTNAADAIGGYSDTMVPPANPAAMTYGTAFIDGLDVQTGNQGVVSQIGPTRQGGFPADALGDLSQPGRNLILFIHGFDNTFSDAVTRAAFNAAWLSKSGNPAADTTMIAFSWPSRGQILSLPVLQADYLADQHMAEQSGAHLSHFLAVLDPIIGAARASGKGLTATLLAHSMGNLALQSAVATWFLNGNGPDMIFNQAILAAGDCPFDTFHQPNLARLSGLQELAIRISVYYSHVDHVLKLSEVVNLGAQRLGQDGPRTRTDATLYPPPIYKMVDCTGFGDYQRDFLTSHQYYRQSPGVRAIIAASL
jgi:esterase/lipase superfamily enzyme